MGGTRGSKQQSGAGRGLLRWEALPPAGRGVRLCVDTCVHGGEEAVTGRCSARNLSVLSLCTLNGIYKRSYPTQDGFPLVIMDTFSRDEHQHLSSIQRGQSHSRSDKFRENINVVKQHWLITSL